MNINRLDYSNRICSKIAEEVNVAIRRLKNVWQSRGSIHDEPGMNCVIECHDRRVA